MDSHNHRFLRRIIGTLSTLLVIAGVALVRNEIKRAELHGEIVELRTFQKLMGAQADKNTDWIARWYADLKVPERDQAQDLGIKQLGLDIEHLGRRVTALEGR